MRDGWDDRTYVRYELRTPLALKRARFELPMTSPSHISVTEGVVAALAATARARTETS